MLVLVEFDLLAIALVDTLVETLSEVESDCEVETDIDFDNDVDWVVLSEAVTEVVGIVVLAFVTNRSSVEAVFVTSLSVAALTDCVWAIVPPKTLPKPKRAPPSVVVPANKPSLACLVHSKAFFPVVFKNFRGIFWIIFQPSASKVSILSLL